MLIVSQFPPTPNCSLGEREICVLLTKGCLSTIIVTRKNFLVADFYKVIWWRVWLMLESGLVCTRDSIGMAGVRPVIRRVMNGFCQ
jgi:hypothetical protein